MDSYINVWIENKGNTLIRAYTQAKSGAHMSTKMIQPGQGQLLKITASDMAYYGDAYFDGFHILSYYVKAEPANSGPISLRVRIKYYSNERKESYHERI